MDYEQEFMDGALNLPSFSSAMLGKKILLYKYTCLGYDNET